MKNIDDNPVKALFFDVGGTLIHKVKFVELDQDVILRMIELLGADCQPSELADTIIQGEHDYKVWQKYSYIELTPEEKWSRYLLRGFPETLVRQHAHALQQLWRKARSTWQLAPDALPTLKELSARGYILGTISHSSPEYLQRDEFTQLLCTQVYAQTFGKRKPHPAIFLATAEQCDLSPDECSYIGDRPSRDVVGSREAGYREVILIKNRYTTQEHEPCPMQANAVISDIAELLEYYPPLNGAKTSKVRRNTPLNLFDGALSTINWDREHTSLNEFFRAGREMGFARFELNHQIPPEVFEQINFNRFHFGSLHNPCPAVQSMKMLEEQDRVLSSLNEKSRQSGVDVLKNTIEHAYRLGARNVVIHSGWVAGDHNLDQKLRILFRAGQHHTLEYRALRDKLVADRRERGKPHLESLIRSYSEIIDFAQGINLMLGVENLMNYDELPNFEEMQVLLETFDLPWFGWQFDTGHLQIMENLGLESIMTWLDAFDTRMVGIHLHDVVGINDHFAPGHGLSNFSAFGARLQPFTQVTVEVKPFVSAEQIRACLPILERSGCLTKL